MCVFLLCVKGRMEKGLKQWTVLLLRCHSSFGFDSCLVSVCHRIVESFTLFRGCFFWPGLLAQTWPQRNCIAGRRVKLTGEQSNTFQAVFTSAASVEKSLVKKDNCGDMWENEETETEIWADCEIQKQFMGAVRNIHVFEKIVLGEQRFSGTPQQSKAV